MGLLWWQSRKHSWRRASLDGPTRSTGERARSYGNVKYIAAFLKLPPSEEYLRLRDTGHRWRTCLRLLRQSRNVCFRYGRQAGLETILEPFRTRYGWGTAASPVLHKERVYVVNDNDDGSFLVSLDKRTGKQIWRVDRDEASNWSTPYIWENERRTEDRDHGFETHMRVRSRWQSAVGAGRDVIDRNPYAVFPTRIALRDFGICRRFNAAGFRGLAGRRGDISLKNEAASSESVAWSLPQAGPYNPSPLVLRRPLLHAARSRHHDLSRGAYRPRDLRKAAHRPGGIGVHGIPVGV